MSLFEMTLKDVFAKIRRIVGSVGSRTKPSESVESASELKKILEQKPEPKTEVVVEPTVVFSDTFGVNDEALEGMVMDELAIIRLRAAQIQMRKAFENSFFDITYARTAFNVLEVDFRLEPVKTYMNILGGFHCVRFVEMPDDVKRNLEFLITKIVDKGFREIYSRKPDNT